MDSPISYLEIRAFYKEQNEAIRRERIFQIRHTAAEVYLEKGLHMEMGDVAKKAGLGRGTVYHYYNNKISLLEDIFLEASKEAQKRTDDAEPALTRLENYIKTQLSSWIEKPCGHGIGPSLHEEPQVAHFGNPGRGLRLKEGKSLLPDTLTRYKNPSFLETTDFNKD